MALGIYENTTNELKLSTCILNISVHPARAFYGAHCLHVRYILHIPHELFTLHMHYNEKFQLAVHSIYATKFENF